VKPCHYCGDESPCQSPSYPPCSWAGYEKLRRRKEARWQWSKLLLAAQAIVLLGSLARCTGIIP
jgi:hypothetical protein